MLTEPLSGNSLTVVSSILHMNSSNVKLIPTKQSSYFLQKMPTDTCVSGHFLLRECMLLLAPPKRQECIAAHGGYGSADTAVRCEKSADSRLQRCVVVQVCIEQYVGLV